MRDTIYIGLFWVCIVSGGVIDCYLLLTNRIPISTHIWNLNKETSSIILFGTLALLGFSYLVRSYWWAPFILGILVGHLFWQN